MTEPLFATLQAERAIRRLISLYCDAVRRKDPGAIVELFTPDARVKIADMPERVGRREIVEGLRRTASSFSFLHQTCDTGLIDVAGDTARARLGVVEANRANGSDCLNVIFGAYEDEYQRGEGGWRFHRRRFSLRSRAVLFASEIQEFPGADPEFTFAP